MRNNQGLGQRGPNIRPGLDNRLGLQDYSVSPSPSPQSFFLWILDFGLAFGTWNRDLELGLGIGTWNWDLGLELGLGNNLSVLFITIKIYSKLFSYENDVDCSVQYKTSCNKLSFACKAFDINNMISNCNANDDHLLVNNKRYKNVFNRLQKTISSFC